MQLRYSCINVIELRLLAWTAVLFIGSETCLALDAHILCEIKWLVCYSTGWLDMVFVWLGVAGAKLVVIYELGSSRLPVTVWSALYFELGQLDLDRRIVRLKSSCV